MMSQVDANFWKNKRVFLTGHTGFKGSWLSLWLQSLGSKVHGLALPPPTNPSIFNEADVGSEMISVIGDIRDYTTVLDAMAACQPDVVIHMASQPLVRYSYQAPVETYATNVMGTVHVLEAARQVGTARAVVNVTTDKCYENKEWIWGYRENEALGGHDPYSNSKSCSELVTASYRKSFFEETGIALASARAGNVIGGGDWAADRLVPDILRAFENSRSVVIRNPNSIRPWQHVVEPLSGYLKLAENLYSVGNIYAAGWNFGPREEDAQTVLWIVERMVKSWGNDSSWQLDDGIHPHEAHYLKLDITKARNLLKWEPRWNLLTALEKTIYWHREWISGADVKAMCLQQINEHQNESV